MSEDQRLSVDGGTDIAEVRTFLDRVRLKIASPTSFDEAVEHLRSVLNQVDELSNLLTRIRNQTTLPPKLAAEVDRALQRVRP